MAYRVFDKANHVKLTQHELLQNLTSDHLSHCSLSDEDEDDDELELEEFSCESCFYISRF